MKKFVSCLLVLTLSLLNLFLSANLRADCVSQYCTCDGQMHPCDFSEADCKAICGGSEPGYSVAPQRDPSLNALYLGFAVAFVAIGVVLYFSGAFNVQQNSGMMRVMSF